jgi:hypothetical protein
MRRFPWLALPFVLACCATLTDDVDLPAAGPDAHVLAFGSIHVDGLLTDQAVQRVLIARTDSADDGARVELVVRGGFFFTEPLPVGTRWRIVSLSLDDEERSACLDFSAEKPGLLFLGSLEVHEGLRRVSAPSERQLLQDLLDALRGTAWEKAVRARIRDTKSQISTAGSRHAIVKSPT